MVVKVMAFGGLREQLALELGDTAEVEMPDGSTVADAVVILGLDPGKVFATLVDGRRSDPSESLYDGAELTLMPAFAGGDR